MPKSIVCNKTNLEKIVFAYRYKLSPRGRRDDMPPADGNSASGVSTSVRGRLRSPHMANLEAASVPKT